MRLLRSRRRTSSFAVTDWYASRDPGAQHPHPVWHVRISCGGPEVAPAEGASTLTTALVRAVDAGRTGSRSRAAYPAGRLWDRRSGNSPAHEQQELSLREFAFYWSEQTSAPTPWLLHNAALG